MPFELVEHILHQIASVRSLSSIIRTGPIFNSCFKKNQQKILSSILNRELGPAIVEAAFTSHISGKFCSERGALLSLYRGLLEAYNSSDILSVPDNGNLEITGNFDAYRKLRRMNFFIDLYTTTLRHSFNIENTLAASPLSSTERYRLLRAFYRRELLFCLLLAVWRGSNRHLLNTAPVLRGGLIGNFSVWERQEIDHVNYFWTRLCQEIFYIAKQEGKAMTQESYCGICRSAEGLFDYTKANPDIVTKAAHLKLLLPRTPWKDSCRTNRASVPFGGMCDLEYLRPYWQAYQFDRGHNGQRTWPLDEDLCPKECFDGENLGRPSFAWVDALGGRRVTWYGEALMNSVPWVALEDGETLHGKFFSLALWRGAGFTLWDKERVENMKKMEIFKSLHTRWVEKGYVLGRADS